MVAPARMTIAAPDRDVLGLTVPADPERLAEVRRTACAFAEQHRVRRPSDVALAVGEACANAIVHAYRDQCPGPMHVSGRIDAQHVYLTVSDEGSGLSPRRDSPGHGLGLAIIAHTTDHLRIAGRPPGTTITMGFARTAVPEPAGSAERADP